MMTMMCSFVGAATPILNGVKAPVANCGHGGSEEMIAVLLIFWFSSVKDSCGIPEVLDDDIAQHMVANDVLWMRFAMRNHDRGGSNRCCVVVRLLLWRNCDMVPHQIKTQTELA